MNENISGTGPGGAPAAGGASDETISDRPSVGGPARTSAPLPGPAPFPHPSAAHPYQGWAAAPWGAPAGPGGLPPAPGQQAAGPVRQETAPHGLSHTASGPHGPGQPTGPNGPHQLATGTDRPGTPPPHPGGARRTLATIGVTALALVAGFGGGLAANTVSPGTTAGQSSTASEQLGSQNTGQVAVNDKDAGSVQAAAAAVLPSVVSVTALSNRGGGEGSGVILTESGLILTNNHVIDGADTLTVQFNDGATANASVVGTDPVDDLAVIRAQDVSGLTPATFGSSADLHVGQQVVAVGSPLGLSATVTTGIVSALNRPVRTDAPNAAGAAGTVLNAIQTDAAINPGNSGGPLVDMKGRVIGINSAIASMTGGPGAQAGSIGVGFAIPIDQAYRVAQEIIDTGSATYAVLGAVVTDAFDEGRGITLGAKIREISSGSGAAEAGLKAGDVITRVGDVPIESSDALVATIRASAPGSSVEVTYLRGGDSHSVQVDLGSSAK